MAGRTQRPPAPRKLRVFTVGTEFSYGVYSNLVFGLESSDPTIAYINGFHATINQIVKETGRRVGMMVVIHPDAKPPTEAVRRHILTIAREFAPKVIAFAHVVEGQGFLAAAKRAAMTFIMTTARFGFPLKVFSNVHEATRWLLATLGPEFKEDIRADELCGLIEELRRTQFAKVPETERRL